MSKKYSDHTRSVFKTFTLIFLFVFFFSILFFLSVSGQTQNTEDNYQDNINSQNFLFGNYFELSQILEDFGLKYSYDYSTQTITIIKLKQYLTLKLDIRNNIGLFKYKILHSIEPVILISEGKIFIHQEVLYSYFNIFFEPLNNLDYFTKWYDTYKKNKSSVPEVQEDTTEQSQSDPATGPQQEQSQTTIQYLDYAKKSIIEYRRIKYIILDAGHGGKAPGAVKGDQKEKDINLYMIKKLESELKKNFPDLVIILTRNDDTYISLEDRVKIANGYNQKDVTGLFLSLHTNASFSEKTSGFEIYYLDYNVADKKIKDLVSTENTNDTKEDVNYYINRLLNEELIYESNFLATLIFNTYSQKKPVIKPNGVYGAPFYVIAYTEMPSILIEMGYITNAQDQKNLFSQKYWNDLSGSIISGIKQFINKYNETKGFKDV